MLSGIYFKALEKAFKNAHEIIFDRNQNYVFMSDLHRGDSSASDDFYKNRDIYAYALKHYISEDFTYIEAGDGDELWKSSIGEVYEKHSKIYSLLNEFIKKEKFYYLWGNHDEMWSNKFLIETILKPVYLKMFGNDSLPKICESLKLIVRNPDFTEKIIFVVHGHQGEIVNYYLWWLNLLINRIIWRNLQNMGVKDFITSPARNFKLRDNAENRYYKWAKQKKIMLIAGHTHRPMFQSLGKDERIRHITHIDYKEEAGQYYFNIGSGVHPNGITCIEIGEKNPGIESLNNNSLDTKENNLRLCIWEKTPDNTIRKRILESDSLDSVLSKI